MPKGHKSPRLQDKLRPGSVRGYLIIRRAQAGPRLIKRNLRPIQVAVTMILRDRRGCTAMTYNDSRQVLM